MKRTEDNAVRDALRRLLPDEDAALRDLQYRPLEGGINRRSFLVETGGARWVLRLPTPGAGALNGVATEAVAMRAAAAAGLAPRVIGADAEHGLLLTEYRAGAAPWTEAAARRPANVARAAALLRALHSVEAEVPAYAAQRIARGYLDALADGTWPAPQYEPARMQSWRRELDELAAWFDAAHPPAGLCHNDLVAANVLDDGRLQLVDFEYSVRASPLLDLAGLAGMNDFAPEQQRALLDSYYAPPSRKSVFALGSDPAHAGSDPTAAGSDPTSAAADRTAVAQVGSDPGLADLERAIRMVRLLSFFWAVLGSRLAADAAPYARLTAELGAVLARSAGSTSSP